VTVVSSEVLRAVKMLMVILRVVIQCGLVGRYQHFRGKYYFNLQPCGNVHQYRFFKGIYYLNLKMEPVCSSKHQYLMSVYKPTWHHKPKDYHKLCGLMHPNPPKPVNKLKLTFGNSSCS
jgi:hypothetical protein